MSFQTLGEDFCLALLAENEIFKVFKVLINQYKWSNFINFLRNIFWDNFNIASNISYALL